MKTRSHTSKSVRLIWTTFNFLFCFRSLCKIASRTTKENSETIRFKPIKGKDDCRISSLEAGALLSLRSSAVWATLPLMLLLTGHAHALSQDESKLIQISNSNVSIVWMKKLISDGVNVNAVDSYGWTAMHVAARYGADQALKVLLEGGGNPNATDPYGETPLHKGADVSSPHLLEQESALVMRVLLEFGADPNWQAYDGNTPLHFAAYTHGHYQRTIGVLLRGGADVNVTNSDGNTPLHLAVIRGSANNPDSVELLVEYGASTDATNNDGYTPLQLFLDGGPDEKRTAIAMLQAGADPDLRDPAGNTAIHAIIDAYIKTGGYGLKRRVITELLAAGADPCIPDAQGRPPHEKVSAEREIGLILDRAGGYDSACEARGTVVAKKDHSSSNADKSSNDSLPSDSGTEEAESTNKYLEANWSADGQGSVGNANHCVQIEEDFDDREYNERNCSQGYQDNEQFRYLVTNTCPQTIYFRYRDVNGYVTDEIFIPSVYDDSFMWLPCKHDGVYIDVEYVYCADFGGELERSEWMTDYEGRFGIVTQMHIPSELYGQYIKDYHQHLAQSECFKTITRDSLPGEGRSHYKPIWRYDIDRRHTNSWYYREPNNQQRSLSELPIPE